MSSQRRHEQAEPLWLFAISPRFGAALLALSITMIGAHWIWSQSL